MSQMNGGDFGDTELDPQEQLDAETNLDDPSASDDEPWSPPDHEPRGLGEGDGSIDEELAEEEPESDAYTDEDEDDIDADTEDEFGVGPETDAMHVEDL